MRRACAILFVGLIGVLPAVDTLVCPDGCADLTHAASSWEHAGNCTLAGTCGLCLNAFFVYRHVATVNHPTGVISTVVAVSPSLQFVTPLIVERPPRLISLA